jgi:hypothetical protein
MTKKFLRGLIVGAHFRPPAKQVLSHLPSGAELRLVPEPDNPYDEFAIRVMVRPAAVPGEVWDSLDAALLGTGMDLDELMAQDEIQLGYVASAGNKKAEGFDHNQIIGDAVFGKVGAIYTAKLGFAEDGRALVLVEVGDA